MKALRYHRHAPWISLSAAFLFASALVLHASASPLPRNGHLGETLALSTALNSSKAFFQGVANESGFDPRHAPNGRFVYSPSDMTPRVAHAANGTTLVNITEPVQTFDIFAPPPAFLPVISAPNADGSLNTSTTQQLLPTNLTPVWTSDQEYIIFASNRSLTSPLNVGTHFHLWAEDSTGDSPPFPLTSGNGDEAFPTINGNDIAFSSTAQPGASTAGTYHNLFTLQFNRSSSATTAIDPSTLISPLEDLTDSSNSENDNYGSSKTFGDSNYFTDVQRPTWSPSGDVIAFSAYTTDASDPYSGHYHIYYLYVNSNGYLGSSTGTANPPALLTDGLADDTDPAWEPAGNGDYIAFASTATAIETNPNANSGTGVNPTQGSEGHGPGQFATLTENPDPSGSRNIFVIGGGAGTLGLTPQGGGRITNSVDPTTGLPSDTDNFGPAWSLTTPNQYLNPEGGQNVYDYLAWARAATTNSPHDIYYMRTVSSVGTATLTPEGVTASDGNPNTAVKLDTDDNGGIVSVSTTTNGTTTSTFQNGDANQYDDIYPTWSPLLSVFSIAYSSNRSITYNYPAATQVFTSTTSNNGTPEEFPQGAPSETAISVPAGQADVGADSGATTYPISPTGAYPAYADIPGQYTTGPTSYTGILQSQVLNLDPPTLLNFSSSEVVHIVDGQNNTDISPQDGQRIINPGDYVTFMVRLSDREAGISNDGANSAPDVYLQIKDPDSKYQDPQHIEHKIFAKPDWYYEVTNEDTPSGFYKGVHAAGGTILHPRPDSGSSTLLTESYFGNESGNTENLYTGFNLFNDNVGSVTNFADGYNTIATAPSPPTLYFPQVGAIGGPDRGPQAVGNISVGKDGGVPNTNLNGTPNNDNIMEPVDDPGIITSAKPALPSGALDGIRIAGGDWKSFIPWGPEYECQYINPTVTSTGRDPSTTAGDYGTPFYLAGYDDQGAYNGYDPTGGDAGAADITPPSNVQPIAQTGVDAVHPPRLATGGASAQWLQLQVSPTQDNNGGVLYSATWKTPSSADATDFYLDVIAYDQARFPNLPTDTSTYAANKIIYTTNQSTTVRHTDYKKDNWRIYDNVWGFSTQQNVAENKDILVVSDYALGQKFAFSTFGGNGASNLPPKIFGTESYVTDVDEGILPDSAFYSYDQGAAYVPPGSTTIPFLPWPVVEHFNNTGSDNDIPNGANYGTTSNTQIENALGVGSYYDAIVGQQNDGDPAGTGYPYCRSQEYAIWRTQCRGPLPSSQLNTYAPIPVTQPALTLNGTTYPPATVQNATKCVIWLSPYTNDLLAPVGTLADPNSQAELEQFVGQGGRLFISGQDVASGLVGDATTNPFLTKVLNVSLASANGGNQTLTGAAGRISGNGQNGGGYLNFPQYTDQTGTNVYVFARNVNPSANPLLLGNDYQTPATERLDASLDQIGGGVNLFDLGESSYSAQIDQVTPLATAGRTDTTDMTDPGAGLTYYLDATTDSRVVYAAFGIEALSTEYYAWLSGTGLNPNTPGYEAGETRHFSPLDTRQNVMHNIVDYLRTGTITGQVYQNGNGTSGVGQPVVGATVYLIPANGTQLQPGTHPYFTGTTASDGSYAISGVDPGNYAVGAVANGFTGTPGTTYATVEGDTTAVEQNIDLQPVNSGSIAGLVEDSNNNPISGATVIFTNTTNPNQVASTTTNANGVYSVNAPVGTYTGVASDPPSYGTETYPTSVTVTSGNPTSGIVFNLPIASSSITGLVTDTSGNPLAGATVTATLVGAASGTGTVSAVTIANGTYSIAPLAPGNYTLTASDAGYSQVGTPPTVTVPAGQSLAAPTIQMQTAQPVQTVITVDGNGLGLSGATVTITNGTVTVTGTTNSSGQFTTPSSGTNALYPGTYTITISATTFETLSSTLTIPNTATSPYDAPAYTLTAVTPVTTGYTANAFNLVSYPNAVSTGSGTAFDEVFGPLRTTANPSGYRSPAYLYDSAISGYLQDPISGLVLGQGYFVYIYQPYTTYGLVGTPPSTSTVTLSLQGGNGLDGWNMIGVPSTSSLSVSSLQVIINKTPVSFANASKLYNAVSPTLYGYNPTSNAYYPISSTGTLQPYQGYWLHANQAGLTLVIPTGVTSTTTTTSVRKANAKGR